MIKVEANRSIDRIATSRGRPQVADTSTFVPESLEETRAPTRVATAGPVASLDSLIALQEVSSGVTGRAKAAKRGRDMLDLLDELRDGLLAGQVSAATVRRLQVIVDRSQDEFEDPALSAVLDEIDLRARVELAKFNFAYAR